MRTGRRTTVRDLSDARDAARAYLAMAGAVDFDGPVNVGAGVGRTTADLVTAVARAAGVAVRHVEDSSLVREGENPTIVADVSLAGERLAWRPEIALEETASDAVAWWTEVLERDPSQGSGVFG